MLKRARIFSVVALVAALFGFTGLLRNTDQFAQTVCLGCAALAFLSLLFSLFEEQPGSPPSPTPLITNSESDIE